MKAQNDRVDETEIIPKSAHWTIECKKSGYFAYRGDLSIFYDNITFEIEHISTDIESQFSFMMSDITIFDFNEKYLRIGTKSGINLILPTGEIEND